MKSIRTFQAAHDPSVCKTFYVELRGVSSELWGTISKRLEGFWVWPAAGGVGTAQCAKARWMELNFQTAPGSVGEVRRIVEACGAVAESIHRVEPTVKGGGRALSKQLDLFGGKT